MPGLVRPAMTDIVKLTSGTRALAGLATWNMQLASNDIGE